MALAFRKRALWIEKVVFPLINAFGNTVVTGEDLAGPDKGIPER